VLASKISMWMLCHWYVLVLFFKYTNSSRPQPANGDCFYLAIQKAIGGDPDPDRPDSVQDLVKHCRLSSLSRP